MFHWVSSGHVQRTLQHPGPSVCTALGLPRGVPPLHSTCVFGLRICCDSGLTPASVRMLLMHVTAAPALTFLHT
jgi:hypothetical protein